jgi:hypothetical protein
VSLASLQIGEYFLFLHVIVFICCLDYCRSKTDALVRGLRHSVYCKKCNKGEAIKVYTDAYKENRIERVSK